jgi:hypothetical protein
MVLLQRISFKYNSRTARYATLQVNLTVAMAIHLAEVERSSQIKSYLKPNEVSESSKITADKLEGPLKGKQVSDLAFAGANGSLYMK